MIRRWWRLWWPAKGASASELWAAGDRFEKWVAIPVMAVVAASIVAIIVAALVQ